MSEKKNIILKGWNKTDQSSRLKEWVESLCPQDLEFLFRHRTIIKDGCWLFQGASISGYGTISKFGLNYLVHRLSANVYHKLPFDSKLKALHKTICFNHNCWNPEHLYVGTQQENMDDAMSTGAHTGAIHNLRTHCDKGHELTPDNIYVPKSGTWGGPKSRTKRLCKICIKIKNARYWQKKKLKAKNG